MSPVIVNISFQFNLQKALQSAAYMLDRLGQTEKVKLMKLLYLSDKAHFIKTGVPITGDRLSAMPYGPVPSQTLDALNGMISSGEVFRVVHTDDSWVMLRSKPKMEELSSSEVETIDQIIGEHGQKNAWDLVEETHNLPEYRECYLDGTIANISYEAIARLSGQDSRYRHGRPVISPETAAAMACPFEAGADADL